MAVLSGLIILAQDALAAPGSVLWAKQYDGPVHSEDGAGAIAVSPDGSTVFVTGASTAETTDFTDDYATVAYDASTGTRQWVKRYDGPSSSDDTADALAVSPDGSKVFVTGYSESGPPGVFTPRDYATVAYDASSGDELWTKRYDVANGDDVALALGVDPDSSSVFVTARVAEITPPSLMTPLPEPSCGRNDTTGPSVARTEHRPSVSAPTARRCS